MPRPSINATPTRYSASAFPSRLAASKHSSALNASRLVCGVPMRYAAPSSTSASAFPSATSSSMLGGGASKPTIGLLSAARTSASSSSSEALGWGCIGEPILRRRGRLCSEVLAREPRDRIERERLLEGVLDVEALRDRLAHHARRHEHDRRARRSEHAQELFAVEV